MFKKIVAAILLLLGAFAGAQNTDPLITIDSLAQKKWVDSLLTNMTIDEKIGQLFMVSAYSNYSENQGKELKDRDYLENIIKNYHVGGLIFMQGNAEKQAELTNQYQAVSKIPLLIGFDGEWGLDMRLKNTYRFPWNMTLGGIRDNALIEDFGAKLGEQCKRMGIHINFAPVVDVNTNPENPIIGNRSFGESKENVTEKALAFVKGMQSTGVLANAKHFPGHGDTSTDSHKSLPMLEFSFQRLDSVELYPYKQLFQHNLASVMVAHLSVPALEPNAALPTSMSYLTVTGLLKEKLNFKGLILTDALNMKGASNSLKPGKLELAAFIAGNDMLLFPKDVVAAIDSIKKAYNEKVFSEERLNYSVRKILKAKYKAGLSNYKPIELNNLQNDLISVENELLHRKLVKNSIALIKNKGNLFPVKELKKRKIAYVKLGDGENDSFIEMLKNYTNIQVIPGESLDEVMTLLKRFNLVIIGYHKSNKSPWSKYQFEDRELVWLQEIAREKKVILSVFTSPYSLNQIKSFKNIESVLVSYQNSKIAQEISAQMIFGGLETKGRLSVSVKNEFNEGTGIITPTLHRLAYSIPEEVGMSSEKLKKVDSMAQLVIDKKMAPGLQILIARNGKVVYQKSFGFHTNEKLDTVKNSDLYDLASMTKILATLPMIMQLEERGVIKLNSKLGNLLPKLKNTNKEKITVKEVLSHYGRLQAWVPFYKKTLDSITKLPSEKYYSSLGSSKYNIKVADNLYLRSDYKDSIFDIIAHTELRDKIGYKYSDLSFYFFKDFIEKYFDKDLNEVTQEFLYKPLGADRTTYLPLHTFPKSSIVPTEEDTYYRHQLLHGYVHDMGAAMEGGIGGHAGLFANANDVAKIMQMYLQKGYYGGKRYFQPNTINKFNYRYYAKKEVRRGLGFDKPQLIEAEKATCGCVSDQSFGHSGFTGTFSWADPETGIVYVFLSNRVYPTMENLDLVKYNIRTEIQRYIEDAIIR